MNPLARNTILTIAAFVSVLVGTLYVMTHTTTLGYDDAFISFRYARNFMAGEGLVFNPGERVEGYSNLLYVLLIAPLTAILSEDSVFPAAVALNGFAMFLGALLLARFPAPHGDRTWPWAAVFLTTANPLVWHAAWSAMETGLVLLGFVALWHAIAWTERGVDWKRLVYLAGSIAFCVLVRADGFILAGVAVCYLGLKKEWRGFAVGAISVAGVFGAHMAWRMAYYGYPMPNTYYAKVSGTIPDRINFAWHTFKTLDVLYPAYVLCAGAVLVWLAVTLMNRRNPLRTLTFEVWFVPVWLAYWFYVGGDIFRHRFLLILIPISAYLFAYRLAPMINRRVVLVACAAVMLYMPAQGHRILSDEIKHDTWIELGRHFRETFPGEAIAVDAAGKMPYYSHAHTIDTLGLNDLHIARVEPEVFIPGHNKHDYDYVLAKRPGIITGWFAAPSLDMGTYLQRSKYTEHGYEIAYVVYLLYGSASEGSYVDVRGMTEEEILDLQFRGYEYGVLLRSDLMDR